MNRVVHLHPPQPKGFPVLDDDAQLYSVHAAPLPNPQPGYDCVALHIVGETVATRVELHMTVEKVREMQRELQNALNRINGARP